MKFTINVAALANALNGAQGTTKRDKDLAILANVRICARNDYVSLMTNNLEAESDYEIPCQRIGVEGSITTDIKALFGVVSRLPDAADVSLEMDVGQLKIQSGRTSVKLPTIPDNDWPTFRDSNHDLMQEPVFFDRERFGEALGKVQHAVSSDGVRPILQNVYIEPLTEAGEVHFTAVDGNRLATIQLAQSVDFAPLMLPKHAVTEVIKMCSRSSESDVALSLWGRNTASLAEFRSGGQTYITKLGEGQFPDWRKVLPKDVICSVEIDATELSRAVGLVTSAYNEKKSPSVAIVFRHDEALVRLDHLRLEASTPIPVRAEFHTGETTVELYCNAPWITDALAKSEKDRTKIHIASNKAAPFLLASDGSPFRQAVSQLLPSHRAHQNVEAA